MISPQGQKTMLIQLPSGASIIREEEHPERLLIAWDAASLQWEAFLRGLADTYGSEWFTVGRIIGEATHAGVSRVSFALPGSITGAREDGGLERSLGKSLAKQIGKRYGADELHLVRRLQTHTKASEWRVLTRATESPCAVAPAEQNTDPLKDFLDACCEERRGSYVTICDLMTAYVWWAEQNENHYPLRREEFSEQLMTKGFRQNRSRRIGGLQCRTWEGLTLRPWALKIARFRKAAA